MSSGPGADALLEVRGLSKAFPGVQALERVDVSLVAGEIHALCGENGAGKSTLIKLLAGVQRADSGAILLDGRRVRARSPREALRLGIATIHQEVALVPELSVAENLFLGRHPRRWWGIDWRAMRERAQAALARVGLSLDVRTRAAALGVAEKQRVAIARALDLSARVLLMDEPTSSLDAREARALHGLVRALASSEIGIVFISHDLAEVETLADRVTVLRGGRKVATLARGAYSRVELVRHMIGREVPATAGPGARRGRTGSAALLEARGLARSGVLAPIDLELFAGEVVGLAGLLGAGKSELLRLLFGAEPRDAGTLRVGGETLEHPTPRRAVAAGLGYCPEDRRADGIFPGLSVLENLVLVAEGRRGPFAPVSRGRQYELAASLVERMAVACSDLEQPVGTLSGGNQQKVLLARWLAAAPRLLLLDEPTRGVDVGAKAEILARIEELARGGLGVLCASAALDELLACADRMIVLHGRAKSAELAGAEVTEAAVLDALAGGARAHVE